MRPRGRYCGHFRGRSVCFPSRWFGILHATKLKKKRLSYISSGRPTSHKPISRQEGPVATPCHPPLPPAADIVVFGWVEFRRRPNHPFLAPDCVRHFGLGLSVFVVGFGGFVIVLGLGWVGLGGLGGGGDFDGLEQLPALVHLQHDVRPCVCMYVCVCVGGVIRDTGRCMPIRTRASTWGEHGLKITHASRHTPSPLELHMHPHKTHTRQITSIGRTPDELALQVELGDGGPGREALDLRPVSIDLCGVWGGGARGCTFICVTR